MSEQSRKIIIGLTGGIACGKSTAGKIFTELGWDVISTDQIVAELLQGDDEVISEIKSRWGDKVLKNSGLDRKAIGRIVFRYEDERKWLESILHPIVRMKWENAVEQSEAKKNIIEIPLLFENNLSDRFDYTICVYASEMTQMKRLLDRGLTKEESNDRIKSQLPINEKSQLADIVLLGGSSLSFLKRQISYLHAHIFEPHALNYSHATKKKTDRRSPK